MPRRLFFRLLSAAAPAGDHVPDSELLRRFTATRDSAAFELLVRRHADAVWAAGLRILGNPADAEDVFQTAFLVLARKAGSVRGPCVGGWLHRVAVTAALKLRVGRAPGVSPGVESAVAPGLTPGARLESAELAAVVHQELARLPDRYRLPVVLCDLEGQTHSEAAKALGWPVGSVSGRLSRARDILRDRLTRRGLAPGVVLSVALSAGPAPAGAVGSSVAAVFGTTIVSPVVSSLTAGVIFAMRIAKLKLTAAVLAATGLVALAGVGVVSTFAQVPPPRAPENPPPPKRDTPAVVAKQAADPDFTAFPDLTKPDSKDWHKTMQAGAKAFPRLLGDDSPAAEPGDDALRKLLKAQLRQGRLELRRRHEAMMVGNWSSEHFTPLLLCLDEMRAVALELWGNDPKVIVSWLEEFVVMGKAVEAFAQVRVDVGNDPAQCLHMARRHRLAAETALHKAKNRA